MFEERSKVWPLMVNVASAPACVPVNVGADPLEVDKLTVLLAPPVVEVKDRACVVPLVVTMAALTFDNEELALIASRNAVKEVRFDPPRLKVCAVPSLAPSKILDAELKLKVYVLVEAAAS